jgi:hypothetical protein
MRNLLRLKRKLKEKQRRESLSPDSTVLTEIFSNDQGLEVDED